MKYITAILTAILLLSCGSKKKVTTDIHIKEDTNIEVRDTTTKVSNIEHEKQFITTDTKERIVTMYSVMFDTLYVEGERIITPIVFPSQTEEFRDISTSNYVWKLKMQDSIRNAIEIKYVNQLEEKEKTITKITAKNKVIRITYILLMMIYIAWIIIVYRKR